MKYNFFNKDKIKNIKLVKEAKYVAFASILAISTLITGCNKTEISDKYTINEIIDTQKDKTTLDDNLEVIKINKPKGYSKITWDEANEEYLKAREEKDIEKCNKYLYIMQKMLLESKLLEAINFDLNNNKIISFRVNKDKATDNYIATLKYKTTEEKLVPGGVIEKNEVEKTKKFNLDKLCEDLSINMGRAYKGKLDFSEPNIERDTNIDNCYRKMCKFALGETTINNSIFDGNIYSVKEPSQKLIKKLKLNK